MSIAKFLNTGRIKTKLDAVIDNTNAFLVDPNKEARLKKEGKQPDAKLLGQYELFDEYFPIKQSDDFRLLEYLLERNMAIASVVANGQEIPQTSAGRMLKVEGQMGKLAISHVFTEDDEIRMHELRHSNSLPQAFIDMLFGSVDGLQPRIIKLANVLTAMVYTQGFVDFTDPRTGTGMRLRYNTYPELMLSPLAGNTPGNAVWSDYVNANGILNLQDHARAFYSINGYYPDETLMSQDLCDDLTRQQATRDQALDLGIIANVSGTTLPSTVSEKVLGEVAKQLKIPPIRVYDAQYEIEVAPGQNVRGRYFPSDSYTFLTKGAQKRILGPMVPLLKIKVNPVFSLNLRKISKLLLLKVVPMP